MKSLGNFLFFCYKINSEATFFYELSVRNSVREYKTCHSPRSFDLCNETSVFCMVDVFELLSKLHVYVQGVRLISVCFKTKLNTFFDIAAVRNRKRGNEGGSRLQFCKIFPSTYREVLWTSNDNDLKCISKEFNDC